MSDPLQQLRDNVAAAPEAPADMTPYLEKVRNGAYSITDEDVDALKKAGFSEDEIFEQTVVTAIGEGLRRLDAALEVIR
jgi:alkylhydroperoxidase family enzyme